QVSQAKRPPPVKLMMMRVRPRSEACSRHDLDDFFRDRRGNRIAVLFKAFEVPRDGVLDVGDRFFAGLPLRDTAGQRRTFSHEYAVFILLDNGAELHVEYSTQFRSNSRRAAHLSLPFGNRTLDPGDQKQVER